MVSKSSVLIVDDNSDMRSAIRRLFIPHPEFEVIGEAEDGQDAIDKARTLHPALIILDLSMPKMNGLEAARLLTEVLPKVRLMLYTSHSGSEVERLAFAAGIHTVVSKADAFKSLIPRAQLLMTA